MKFELVSQYTPAGDQPKAISALVLGLERGLKKQTLLGVTGSGKTFTIAHVIQQVQKPTLVIAPNKTLAAQLCNEFRTLFPNNAVHYFVSYYDYYQPEAYMPMTDTYIGKEAMINDEIDKLRHAATAALLTRKDVIIVASVSCIYGLGAPESYEATMLHFLLGGTIDRRELMHKLVAMYFTRTNADLKRGSFRLRGDKFEIMPADQELVYTFELDKGLITKIYMIDPVKGFSHRKEVSEVYVFPAKHFITPVDVRKRAIAAIKLEMRERLKYFENRGELLEAERIERRTKADIAMISEVGYCHGIENYSRHLSGRDAGAPPDTLLAYFPEDFLLVVDESHVTLPQLQGMYYGDASRKKTLIEFGFRLPSAADNRPLKFEEFLERVDRSIYCSATPGDYELRENGQVVEQIIRPTGLIDPEIIVRPILGSAIMGDRFVASRRSTTAGTPPRGASRSPHASASFPDDQNRQLSQVDDLIVRIKERAAKKERILVTTLTKKMAEDLTSYLQELKIKVNYVHSDVDTLDRIRILSDFRRGKFDVLVGVNLLREGLDLPEVTLVAILDADKEGFLRSETSLIQTIGRAARNVDGQVVLYADVMTSSLTRAIAETNRRRELQIAHNKKHGITPQTIQKAITDIVDELGERRARAVSETLKLEMLGVDSAISKGRALTDIIRDKEREMKEAAKSLDFELAAILRDEIRLLKAKISH